MKHTIHIKTLTPIHIGSGTELNNNIDFIIHNQHIHIIDYNKLSAHINREQISSLHTYFEQKKSIKDILPQNFDWNQISKRSIKLNTNVKEKTNFFEFIHDARFRPYIPGSSIKGPINTAIYLIQLEDQKPISLDKIKKEKNYSYEYSDKQIILKKDLFYNFYRISDAYFEKNTTLVEPIIAYTYHETKEKWNNSPYLSVFAEIIPQNTTSQLYLELPSEKSPFHHEIINKIEEQITISSYKKLFPLTLSKLFSIINQFTLKLIEKEIEILESTDEPFSETYENKLVEISKKLTDLNQSPCPDTAILRIGKYTGFNNLTGHWHEDLLTEDAFQQFNDDLFKDASLFPKTRRITSSGQPFGFIQLSAQHQT